MRAGGIFALAFLFRFMVLKEGARFFVGMKVNSRCFLESGESGKGDFAVIEGKMGRRVYFFRQKN